MKHTQDSILKEYLNQKAIILIVFQCGNVRNEIIGRLISYNSEDLIFYTFDKRGFYDGIGLVERSHVTQVEDAPLMVSTLIHLKEETLPEVRRKSIGCRDDVLKLAKKQDKIIEVQLDGQHVYGVITKLKSDWFQLQMVDDYGEETTSITIAINSLAFLRYDSKIIQDTLILRQSLKGGKS